MFLALKPEAIKPSDMVYSGNLAYGAKATEATLRLAGGVNLTNTITPTLTFWQQANWSVPAEGQLLISTDGGIEWQPVYTVTTNTTGWEQVTVDLTPYAGQTIELAYFLTVDGVLTNPAEGWYIDEWQIVD